MKSIFFDLETTDLNTVGQILNYAFVEVNDDWSVESKLTGTIKISRTQLPNPYAVLATKIDVIKHNEESTDSEHIALAKIQKYLQNIIEKDEVKLIGYNSNRFDIPYLRTSMIRNGLNPYFGGCIKYGDVLHAVKRLCCDNEDFVNLLEKNKNGRTIHKLESVVKSLGIMNANEKQDHESLADVLLTIKLAKHLLDNYDLDIRNYNSYEVKKNRFDVVKVFPFIDENGDKVSDEYCYYAILEQNKNQALWINIKKFEEGLDKKSVSWYNKTKSSFFVKEYLNDESLKTRASIAKKELSHITLENFFPPKNCDIEQFIYMMPIGDISALYDAVWRNDLFLIKNRKCKFASQLYLRFLCNNLDVDRIESTLKEYAIYRYGGKLKLDKNNFEVEYQDGVYSESFHPTYNELIEMIDILSKDSDNKFIMSRLKDFYENSIVSSLAGDDLKNIKRIKNI